MAARPSAALRPPTPLPVLVAVLAGLVLTGLALAAAPAPAGAQSVLDRSPNLGGTWTGRSGMGYFNFQHRFTHTGAPVRKVVSYPTFLLGVGLPARVLAGVRYATNSELVAGVPNEWELFARWAPLAQAGGAPVDLAAHGAFNEAARSGDAELSMARTVAGRLRLLAAGRFFSNAFDADEARWALAGGATLRLTSRVALAADYATLVDAGEDEDGAWSAGVQLAIPGSPHTLSLQASNAATTTLEGSSLGVGETRWGFEFTVPLTLSRLIPGRGDDEDDDGAAAGMNGEGAGAARGEGRPGTRGGRP